MNERTINEHRSDAPSTAKRSAWHRLPSTAEPRAHGCCHLCGHLNVPQATDTRDYGVFLHVYRDTWTVAVTRARGLDERIAVVLTTRSRAVALRKLRSITKSAKALLDAHENSPRESYRLMFGSLVSALHGDRWSMQGHIALYAIAHVQEG